MESDKIRILEDLIYIYIFPTMTLLWTIVALSLFIYCLQKKFNQMPSMVLFIGTLMMTLGDIGLAILARLFEKEQLWLLSDLFSIMGMILIGFGILFFKPEKKEDKFYA